MTLGRCPLSIFCSREAPPTITPENLLLGTAAHLCKVVEPAPTGGPVPFSLVFALTAICVDSYLMLIFVY